MSGITEITKPADEPVTLSEIKDYLRLDDQVDDGLLRGLIITARNHAETYTGRNLIQRTMKLSLDGLTEIERPLKEGFATGPFMAHYRNYIELPMGKIQSVTQVKYYDDGDNESTWATSNYYVDTAREPGRIVLRDGGNFPTDLRKANGIEVTYVGGYGENPTDVPESIRTAILQQVTFMYEHRGDFERFPPPKPPVIINQLLQPYKIMRFSNTATGYAYAARF